MVQQWQREQLGENIRHCRMRNGIAQGDAARAAGLAVSTLQSWEHGAATPDAVRLKELAVVLGVPVQYLLAGTTDIPVAGRGTSREK